MVKFFKERRRIRQFILGQKLILILPFNGIREDVSRHWHHILKANPLRGLWKVLVFVFAKPMPSSWLKNALLRSTGMRIGKHVFIGQGASLDPQFPELITLEDNAIVGIDAHIMTHEITHRHVRLGKVRIGKNALIGAMAIIRSGVSVGPNAVVGIGTLVVKDVAPGMVILGGADHIEKKSRRLV